jgi:Spy/CpxP family protein refolding chaperone
MTARGNKLLFISTAFVLLALAPPRRAAAQGGPPPVAPAEREAQEGRRQTRQSGPDQLELMRALNLTPEQRARVAEIRRETEERARLNNVRLRRARRALEEAIYAEEADDSAIEARTREVAEAEAARARSRAEAELKVRRVLRPEQLGTFRELRRQAMMEQRRQRRASLGTGPRPGAPRLPRDGRQRPASAVGIPGANTRALPPPPRRQIEPGRRPRP